uniref:C2H2-type domain-containing protein n=1 Tax=Strix occidentalis caurina TaxID=311401 RepID=A0A8D0FIR9_STROC
IVTFSFPCLFVSIIYFPSSLEKGNLVQVDARPEKFSSFTRSSLTCFGEGGMSACSLTPSGVCVLSDNEEERGIPEGLKEDTLLQKQQRGKVHTKEKPCKCTECGKGFKGRSRLLNHLQTHTRANTFECVECGKSFSRKANLVVHQRIHTGERPYKCKECEKTFSRTSNLIAHRKTHAKKKAFSCTTCRKSFSGSAALFQHQRVHIDEKPYRCTECGNSFRLCSNFIKHQRIHLRETSTFCCL